MRLTTGSVQIDWDKNENLIVVEIVPSDVHEESFTLFEFLSSLGITAKQARQAYADEDNR